MDEYLIYHDTMEDIADAIRDRAGTSEPIYPTDMPNAIRSIPSDKELLVVHCTGTVPLSGSASLTSDKTFSDVTDAVAAGQIIIVILNNKFLFNINGKKIPVKI